MSYVLQTRTLTKKYKNQFAVNGADMNIRKGDIYGFVGENGSGKTTIIRLITGLIFPYSGSFELFGVPNTSPEISKARRKVGAVVETPSIYRNMSAYDNLKMQSVLLGINDDAKIKETLEDVGLGELYGEKKSAGNFSLGMRQRLGIAMALMSSPEFLLLDEPMNGLDPAGIVEIRELILKLNREKGITFLISSHILTELSLVATKYGIISKGKIIKEITADELRSECEKSVTVGADKPQELSALLAGMFSADRITYLPDGAKISGEVDLNALLGAVIAAGIKLTAVNCNQFSIEDYYLSVIGGAHHD